MPVIQLYADVSVSVIVAVTVADSLVACTVVARKVASVRLISTKTETETTFSTSSLTHNKSPYNESPGASLGVRTTWFVDWSQTIFGWSSQETFSTMQNGDENYPHRQQLECIHFPVTKLCEKNRQTKWHCHHNLRSVSSPKFLPCDCM